MTVKAKLVNVGRLSILLLALLLVQPVLAAPAGNVQSVYGMLSAHKADGSTLILTRGSAVNAGDSLETQAGSFARVQFRDGSLVTLRPRSVFKIEAFQFEQTAPERDSLFTRLVRGGLRTITGLIGKRSRAGAYRLSAATATIGIRGTVYSVRTCSGDCPGLKDGTYLLPLEGALIFDNPFGSVVCSVGQVCFSPPDAPPVMLPEDPGVDFDVPRDEQCEIL